MKALTIQIGIFGRINVGKSSLMNFITNQSASIVSSFAGTTTDVVNKQMELNPLGPITLFDTAGIDDISVLSDARIEKTNRAFDSSDIVMLMCEADKFGVLEENIIKEAGKRETPCIIVIGKTDLQKPSSKFLEAIKKYSKNVLTFSAIDSNRDDFLNALKKILVEELPDNYIESYLSLRNIVSKDDTVILVMPIDRGAPRGKIIMPQIQTLRHILDLNACSYTVQDSEYESALQNLKVKPVLVITDSQAIKRIAQKTPSDIKLTTFSTIYAADKSDIVEMAKGAAAIDNLKDGDKVLIAEACAHHASADDIGRVKLPKWIRDYSKKDLEIKYVSGQDYPKDISNYKVIIHCGACTLNRKAMLSRLDKAIIQRVPITNYGIAISVVCGVIEKTLEVFPEALRAYKNSKRQKF
ncbi:MAG: [FeFe] hydrogenase H-cluster maturation GTPase HydF [Elusimicrobiota bacterium]|jgi:[FeFe] hydrogenase H-cluster maturation GTPase HydF|nr:[FeFe] hydrogenase H-cluster maturation GTPase HydF [Elusimicrobiota bacterium]